MSNYPGRLPRHNPSIHGSSKSLWDVKSRLAADTPIRRFASSIYGSSVSLSPSGTNVPVFGAERRPKKIFPYGLSAKDRIKNLTRLRFASSCDNVATTRSDKERRHTLHADKNDQRNFRSPASVPTKNSLVFNVRFNTLSGQQKSGRSIHNYSGHNHLTIKDINVVGISGGGEFCVTLYKRKLVTVISRD